MSKRLSNWTTFRLGGECRELVTAGGSEEIAGAIRQWNAANIPWRVMGGGSNLLVADEGIEEAVLRVVSEDCDAVITADGVLSVSGGASLDAVAALAADEGWGGLGFASGIPGTVGGGLHGNAGAFGAALGDVLIALEVIDATGTIRTLQRSDVMFLYRRSSLQDTCLVISRAWFQLQRMPEAQLQQEREHILAMRREKHPDWRVLATGGSFFKNLPPANPDEHRQAAGRFLEAVGAKSMRVGGAYVFEKHANIVMAEPGAAARDVLALSQQMAAAVKARFGVELEREVKVWGLG